LSVEDSRGYSDNPPYHSYQDVQDALAARRQGLKDEPLLYHDFSGGKQLTVYADLAVRDEAKALANFHGLNLSVVVNAMLKRFLREGPSIIEE